MGAINIEQKKSKQYNKANNKKQDKLAAKLHIL